MIIKRSLPASTIFELLWLSLPNIIVLTVPMSLLFGILIAVGRLSADSEIISMRALGISTRTIYRPVFLFSFLAFLLNFYLMNVLLPRGNSRLQALKAEIYTASIEKELRPRVFYDEYANVMIYVNDVDARLAGEVRDGDLSYREAVGKGLFRPVGAGGADVAAVVEAVSRTGYRGWYGLEMEARLTSVDDDPLESVRASLDHLRSLLPTPRKS